VRKFWSAASAPSVVEADAGMIVGGGKGAVYGMRMRGMPGTHSFNRRQHLLRENVLCERGVVKPGQPKKNVVTSVDLTARTVYTLQFAHEFAYADSVGCRRVSAVCGDDLYYH
jgi:hypothetical protein